MNDLQMLLRAILEHPNEDTPRLMYTDALEETDRFVVCPSGSMNGPDSSGREDRVI